MTLFIGYLLSLSNMDMTFFILMYLFCMGVYISIFINLDFSFYNIFFLYLFLLLSSHNMSYLRSLLFDGYLPFFINVDSSLLDHWISSWFIYLHLLNVNFFSPFYFFSSYFNYFSMRTDNSMLTDVFFTIDLYSPWPISKLCNFYFMAVNCAIC